MTEEEKTEKTEEHCHCICKSKWFRKFIIITLGSFIGVFCALSLFAALHKPPVFHHPHRYMILPPPPVEYKNPFENSMNNHMTNLKKHRQSLRRDFDKNFSPKMINE